MKWLIKILTNIDNSFKNNDLGYSGRKLSGFATVALSAILVISQIVASFNEKTIDQVNSMLVILLGFSGLVHSIYTLDGLSRFTATLKGSNPPPTKETIIETEDTTVTTKETK